MRLPRSLGVLHLCVLLLSLSAANCAARRAPLPPAEREYVEVPLSESGEGESEEEMDITIPAFNPLTAADPTEVINARFRGVDRKAVKIGIATASRESFGDLDALIGSLPDDDDMLNHDPEIRRDSGWRAEEEERNVRVNAWIYAIKYEHDQDWHVILGTDPSTPGEPTYFNAEVSGLPANNATSFRRLQRVRQQLAKMFDNDLPLSGGYSKYKKPAPVVVEGSLFFDVDHKAGVVGPEGMRPDTAWEIHPITNLRLQ